MRGGAGIMVLALVGCTKDAANPDGAYGALPDARVTYLAQGDGLENELPLEPMRTGVKGWTGTVEMRWGGVVDAGHDDLAVMEIEDLTKGGRDGMGLFRASRDGVVVHALDEHLLADTLPVLMVPDTVRVGMAWESEYGDGLVNHQTVIAHQSVVLPIGPVSAWAIAEEQGDATGSSKIRWYAEGIGRVVAGSGGETISGADAFPEMVVPDEAQDAVQASLDPAPLTPVLDPLGHPIDVRGVEIYGVSGAERDGALWLYASAPGGSVCITLDPAARLVRPGSDPMCPVVPDAECRYLGYGQYSCYEVLAPLASAALLVPGSDLHLYQRLDRESAQSESHYGDGGCYDSTCASQCQGLTDPAGVAACGSEVEPLTTWSTPEGLRCLDDRLQVHEGEDLCLSTTLTQLADDTMMKDVFRRYSSPTVTYIRPLSAWVGLTFFGPSVLDDADAPMTIGAVDGDGTVYRFVIADGRMSGPTPIGVMPGRHNVFVDDAERVAYAITTDGRAFRARVDSGDVIIESLGDVELVDPGYSHETVSIVPDPTHPGDYIVALTSIGDYAWYGDELVALAEAGTIYPSGLYRATLDREPVRVVSPSSLLVRSADILGALAVCWPPSDEPFHPEGWTVGGKPAQIALGDAGPDGNCAVLVADGAPDPAFVGAERAISGTIPGVGHARLASQPRPIGHALDALATVLGDGSVIDIRGIHLDPRGMELEPQAGWEPGSVNFQVTRDIGGLGFWSWDNWGGGFRNIGADIAIPSTCGSTCYAQGTVVGGGILVYQTGEIVRRDRVDVVPPAQLARLALLGSAVVLEDGRICGVGSLGPIACASPDGTLVTAVGGPGSFIQVAQGDSLFWPLPGGDFLVHGDKSYRFDPEAMTVTLFDERVVDMPITAEDGEVYGLIESWGGEPVVLSTQVARITDSGLEPMGPSYTAPASALVVLPLEGQLIIGLDGYEPLTYVRKPTWARAVRP